MSEEHQYYDVMHARALCLRCGRKQGRSAAYAVHGCGDRLGLGDMVAWDGSERGGEDDMHACGRPREVQCSAIDRREKQQCPELQLDRRRRYDTVARAGRYS